MAELTSETIARRMVIEALMEPQRPSLLAEAIVRQIDRRRAWGEAVWTAPELYEPLHITITVHPGETA